jgi:hypothetical protein
MKINTKQRIYIINQIVDDICDGQASSSYDFMTDNNIKTIIWNDDMEVYILLRQDYTYNIASPGKLFDLVREISDQQLIEWFVENTFVDPIEEITQEDLDGELNEELSESVA